MISYSLDQAHINSFLRSGLSMRAFIGTVETIYLNQYKQSKREYKANLENLRSNTGSPCPPQEETFTYSSGDALIGDYSTSDLGSSSTTTQISSGVVEICITYFEPSGTGLECTPEVHELLKAVSPIEYEEEHKDDKCKSGEGSYVRKTRCQMVNHTTTNTGDGCVSSEIEDIAVLGPETQDIFEMLESETDPRIRALIMADFITGNADTEDREAAIILTQLLVDLIGPQDGTDAEIQAAVDAIHTLYYQVKARALQQIFSVETIATILSFGIGNPSYTPQTRAHVIKVISRASALSKGKGFTSFEAFKRAYGPAGEGKAWHHIVNQKTVNITKFGAEKIHNTNNLVKLPHGSGTWHNRITGFFNTKNPLSPIGRINTNEMTFGQWVAQKSFQEQYEWGLKVMNWMK